jgi:hypothetical protein
LKKEVFFCGGITSLKGLASQCLIPNSMMACMKYMSEHEVNIQMMRGGKRVHIIGTAPTIMLSINDTFQGWFADTHGAWSAFNSLSTKSPLDHAQNQKVS